MTHYIDIRFLERDGVLQVTSFDSRSDDDEVPPGLRHPEVASRVGKACTGMVFEGGRTAKFPAVPTFLDIEFHLGVFLEVEDTPERAIIGDGGYHLHAIFPFPVAYRTADNVHRFGQDNGAECKLRSHTKCNRIGEDFAFAVR